MDIRYSQLCKIREIVNKYDPEGLIALGAPSDEYYDLVDKLIDEFKTIDHNNISNIIVNFFAIYDEAGFSDKNIGEMAKEIDEVLKN